MASEPNVPRSKTNPVGQTKRIADAEKLLRADIRAARGAVLREWEAIPTVVRNEWLNSQYYEYQIDLNRLEAIVEAARSKLRYGEGSNALRRAVEAAYREGVARTSDNIAGQMDDFPRQTLQRLGDANVIRRAAIAGSRAMELMDGFSGQTGADLARVLFEAVQSGENPRQTAKTIRERFGVSRTRAERIARTEITQAHRRGRWDEARDVEEKFGITTKLLHVSALIFDRTRRTHAERHGRLYTRAEEAAWYGKDGNAINCLCTQTEVVVDEDGKPLFGTKLMERMGAERNKFLGIAPPKKQKTEPAKPKPPSPIQQIEAEQPIFAANQGGAFNAAPALIFAVLRKVGDLDSMITGQAGAYAQGKKISMGRHQIGTTAYSRVFRHEHGHVIDDVLGQFVKAQKLAYGVQRVRFFGSFEAVDDLIEDGARLNKGRTGRFQENKNVISDKQLADNVAKAQAGWDVLYSDLVQSKQSKTEWMDGIMRKYGIGADDFLSIYGKTAEELSAPDLSRLAAAWERKDVYELLYFLPHKLGLKIGHDSPFAGLQDTYEASVGAVSRIHFGHGSSYYQKNWEWSKKANLAKRVGLRKFSGFNTGQAFANWTEAYASGSSAQELFFRHLFPQTSASFERMLKQFVGQT